MRAAKHNYGVDVITPFGVVQQLPGEAPSRLHEQVERILCRGSPRNYHEWVGLEEGPEADGRDPQVYVSACLKLYRPWEVELHLDRAGVMVDGRTCETMAEGPISDDDGHALQEEHECGNRQTDIDIGAREGVVRGDMSPDRINGSQGKGLV